MSFDHLRGLYFDECAELLDSAYACLASLQDGSADAETLHRLFRAIHSIKGGGGTFGFERMVGFAHAMETLLDLLRSGDRPASAGVIALLLRGTDALADLVRAEQTGVAAPDGMEAALLDAFAAAAAGNDTSLPASAAGWRIRFAPLPGLLRSANEPLLLIRALRQLGPLQVAADLSRLPPLAELVPDDACLAWSLQLQAPVPRSAVEEIFEFVLDDCELELEELAAGPAPAVAAPKREASSTAPANSVRVDVGKVDRLVNLVGELVIHQAMLLQLGNSLPPGLCPGLVSGLETLSQHLRELQEGVMAIRTQPVRNVFARMPRLVRELADQLGKEAQLILTGEATEIDKTVIEQLADPLTHLLRNALDHGLESPEERIAAGKPRQGSIHLGAEQRSGRIVIEVADDGRGLDRAKVLARARERGLVAVDAQPTEAEIDDLIFLPGFSTAAAVSAVSGRGVGMDVVRSNIQSLGGRISLESRSGAGTRFLLSLPLTLAVMDGLVVAVGREAYIVPIAAIVESLRPAPEDIHHIVGRGHDALAVRGAYVPLLPLGSRFGVDDAEPDAASGIVVIVEADGGGQVGLVVDELLGQQQVVVKSLEANYGPIQGIGGATILGDGRVALILDVPGLTAAAVQPPRPRIALPDFPQLH